MPSGSFRIPSPSPSSSSGSHKPNFFSKLKTKVFKSPDGHLSPSPSTPLKPTLSKPSKPSKSSPPASLTPSKPPSSYTSKPSNSSYPATPATPTSTQPPNSPPPSYSTFSVHPPPHTTATFRSQTLWDRALSSLPPANRALFASLNASYIEILTSILTSVTQKRDQVLSRRWTVKIGNTEIVLRNIAEQVVKTVQKFKSVGDVIAQYDPVMLSPPWAAIRFLLQLGIDEAEKMAQLLVATDKIANVLNRCEIYEALHLRGDGEMTKAQENLTNALVELYSEVLKYLVEMGKYLSGNTAVRGLSGVLADGDNFGLTGIEKAEEAVGREFDVVEAECRRGESKRIEGSLQNALRELLKELNAPLKIIGDDVEHVRKAIDEKERVKVLNWYSKVQYAQHHNRAKENRIQNTGEWLFSHQEYIKWIESAKSSILWLHGIPGSGKTKLASAVVDRLTKELSLGETIIYHYCDREEPERSDVENIIRCLLRQLAAAHAGSIDEVLLDDYSHRRMDGFASGLPSLAESMDLLSRLLKKRQDRVYLVIDALDESTQNKRRELLTALSTAANTAPVKVQIFITSRDEQDIVRWMKSISNLPNLYIGGGMAENSADIERYIKAELQRCIDEEELLEGVVSDDLKARICGKLIERADGCFLWARYQILHLCELEFAVEVEDALETLPRTMDEIYARIYDKILKQKGVSKMIGISALSWTVWGSQPLTVDELVDAIYHEIASGKRITRAEINPDIILKCSGYLIVVDKQLNLIRPAHLTVMEYMKGNYAEEANLLHERAADASLRALLDSDNEGLKKYAILYWPTHVQMASATLPSGLRKETISLLARFFGTYEKPGKAFLYWHKAAGAFLAHEGDTFRGALARWYPHLIGDPVNPLAAAAVYGLYIPTLFYSPFDVTYRNSRDETLLHLATKCVHLRNGFDCGHSEIVKVLLEKGADVNAEGGYDGFAMANAIATTDIRMVKALLDYGAKMDVPTGEWSTALQLAVFWKAGGVVEMLIDRGADVNQCSGYYHTALQCAAEEGKTGMVELLLRNGADPNIIGGRWNTALEAALVGGFWECAKVLLEAGADVTYRVTEPGTMYGTPLMAVCAYYEENEEILEMILDRLTPEQINGPPVGIFGSPIAAISRWPGKNVLLEKMIARKVFDIDLAGGVYGSAVGVSAFFGIAMNLKTLILAGAKVDIPSSYWGPPLSLACWSGKLWNPLVLDWILDAGADVNTISGTYGTALQCACTSGELPLVTHLLSHNADPNLFSPSGYGSPLQAAISNHHPEITSLLLSHGATSSSSFPSPQPSPTHLSLSPLHRGPGITLSPNGLNFTYNPQTANYTPATILSNQSIPIFPSQSEPFYFELTLHPPSTPTPSPPHLRLAIGLLLYHPSSTRLNTRPGLYTTTDSWGWHSEDGVVYSNSLIDQRVKRRRGPRWGVGDTVGLGVWRGCAWGVKNGVFLGVLGSEVDGVCWAGVGVGSGGVRGEVNFGKSGESMSWEERGFRYKGREWEGVRRGMVEVEGVREGFVRGEDVEVSKWG